MPLSSKSNTQDKTRRLEFTAPLFERIHTRSFWLLSSLSKAAENVFPSTTTNP